MKVKLLIGVGGVIVGIILSQLLFRVQSPPAPTPTPSSHADHSLTMTGMVDSLSTKSGEEFDREFIVQMIEHHQGAIDMARLALDLANHPEIKELANNIIDAQTTEIAQMQHWFQEWGYSN